jgi:beta-mannanase
MESRIGHTLARHVYADFGSGVGDYEFYTVGSGGYTWRQVANMQPGSSLYNNVVRWAQALRDKGGRPYFAYSHEPTQSSRTGLGGAEDFKDAFRKVVSVMRSHGATNVQYTWQMVGWSFAANPDDRIAAAKWYPGDAAVDVVGPDEYNWYTCGEGRGKWVQLGDLVNPALAFARNHGKKLALPEFASYTDARRDDWLRSAHSYFEANSDTVTAVFYFHRAPTNKANMDCVWGLQTQSEFDAYAAMARDTAFRTR